MLMAQEEARQLGRGHIGTEHLLLGLVRMDEAEAGRALEGLGVTPARVRDQVMTIVGRGEETPSGRLEFAPQAKKALARALREARSLGQHQVGSVHLLLGLVPPPRRRLSLRSGDRGGGVVAQILLELDADAEQIRAEVLRLIGAEPTR